MKKLMAVFVLLVMSVPFASANSCWGEASAAFGKLGIMGEHASQQTNPRQGLANVAHTLYELGLIAEPTMSALGEYLAAEAGVTLERCLSDGVAVSEAESIAAADAACWGQASKVFASTGAMGQHSSSYPTPRLGIRNLARSLAELGVIPDDSMASLGQFVAAEFGYDIDACN
jgi:hypothetical protein